MPCSKTEKKEKTVIRTKTSDVEQLIDRYARLAQRLLFKVENNMMDVESIYLYGQHEAIRHILYFEVKLTDKENSTVESVDNNIISPSRLWKCFHPESVSKQYMIVSNQYF